ncbi:MAG: hypothetical protein M3094_07330 [Actinomycetia bacterium]|nr:hypothetical protein [Actinomycetes bacterium]
MIDDTDLPPTQGPGVSPYTVAAILGEAIPAAMREVYIADLDDRVRELVGSEPKDFARAAILIYDIFWHGDEPEKALEIGNVFDLPAMVLFQVPPLVRAIHRMGPTPPTATRAAALEQIDDLIRLVIMVLGGESDAEVLRRLDDLRHALSATQEGSDRYEAVTAVADHLSHLVNAFFFDRLTAIPAVRNYVVGLELGL